MSSMDVESLLAALGQGQGQDPMAGMGGMGMPAGDPSMEMPQMQGMQMPMPQGGGPEVPGEQESGNLLVDAINAVHSLMVHEQNPKQVSLLGAILNQLTTYQANAAGSQKGSGG